MDVYDNIKSRNLPEFTDRKSAIELILKYEYGRQPNMEYSVSFTDPQPVTTRFCCETAGISLVKMTVTTRLGSHTVPFYKLWHRDGKKHPVFIYPEFDTGPTTFRFPAEEIADMGADVLTFNYEAATTDDGDFKNRLAGILLENGQDTPETCGKIGIWAWTVMRLLDYAEGIPSVDMAQAAVIGHSRLGKTALLAGMLDERFRYVFSNNSGCSGAALSRGNSGILVPGKYPETGETVAAITRVFPFWFCKNYLTFAGQQYPDDFDQHFMLGAVAPRFVYVASADGDKWADPVSEFCACIAASPAYEKLGLTGFECEGRLPVAGDVYHNGRIGYHMRHGGHFISRHDWKLYIDYINLHADDKL